MKGHLKKENGKTLGLETINDVHLENLFRAILNIRDEYYKYSLEQLEGSDEYQEQLERVLRMNYIINGVSFKKTIIKVFLKNIVE